MPSPPTLLINSTHPLLLLDRQTAWLVQSGSIAVFAVALQDQQPRGERHYLFSVMAGEALFGVGEEQPIGLLAVPLEPAVLKAIEVKTCVAASLAQNEINGSGSNGNGSNGSGSNGLQQVPIDTPANDVLAKGSTTEGFLSIEPWFTLLEGWIHHLGEVAGLSSPSRSQSAIETGMNWTGSFTDPLKTVLNLTQSPQYLSLPNGQRFQAPSGQVVWLQVQHGQALWLGDAQLPIANDLFPVSDRFWLEAVDELELLVQTTATVTDWQALTAGLTRLHACFLHSVEQIQQRQMTTAVERLQARQSLDRQVTQKTIRQLTTVLQPQPDSLWGYDSPLLVAAGAVGRSLGVTIEPPGRSEDLTRLKEPLEAIARASQLRLRRVLLRGNWWEQDGGPLLAYTRDDRHPVALLPRTASQYELLDPVAINVRSLDSQSVESAEPVTQPRPMINATIADSLDPVAFMFYRPLPRGVIHAWDLLRFALAGRRRDWLLIVWTGIAAALLGMLVPQLTAVLIDQAIPYGETGLLIQMGLALAAVALGSASFQLAQSIAALRLETISDASLQAAVWDRLLQLKPTFFRQYSTGDLNSRVYGINAIRQQLSGTVLQTIFASFFALLNLGLLLYYSPRLALFALIIAIIVMTFTILSGALLIRKNKPLMELEGELIGLMVQLISGVPKLRLSGAEARAFAHWGQKYAQQLRLLLSTQQLEDRVTLFNALLPPLTTIALYGLASTMMQTEATPTPAATPGFTTGTFLAFYAAFGTFMGGVTSLSNTVIEVLDIVPLWQRSQPILTAEPEVNLQQADPGRLTGEILIDHVSFRYREDGPLILDDVTLRMAPGEFIAIVGPSGSGKSTLMRILLGFDTPISGTVYYDNQDLSGLDVAAVRRQLGVVLQNGRINAGSIFENIASGALIAMEEAWAAADRAGLGDDIRSMPMQMHTVISEGGTNLSGGQRQRLIIARALALKPRILFLDEATSALDNRTQAVVSQSLDALQVTRIVIAHRLSTIRNADRIYVLESGRLVQQGTFTELAEQPGLFAQLIQRQQV